MDDKSIEFIFWGLQLGMSVIIVLWGRAQKQSDALIAAQIDRLKSELAASVDAHDKLLASQFEVRDQQLLSIHDRLDKAGQKASDTADLVMVKIAAIDHRITIIEARV